MICSVSDVYTKFKNLASEVILPCSIHIYIYIYIRGIGYMDVVEALLRYRYATNIFLQISKKMFHTSKY
jgi:hypothetical protein